MKKVTAVLLSVGDELLLGQVLNTNAHWLSARLAAHGFTVVKSVTIGDRKEEIIESLDDALDRAEVVIITGGLGPTRDDLTKDALCRYFNCETMLHQPALDHIRQLFKSRNIPITQENEDQSLLPAACLPLPNNFGTAWGMWFEKNSRVVVSLPGVPYEMEQLMEDEVLPRLVSKYGTGKIHFKTLLTAGVQESVISSQLSSFEDHLDERLSLAYLPSPGQVRLRLTVNAGTAADLAEELLHKSTQEVKAILGDIIWGEGEASLQEVAGEYLMKTGLKLVVAESCTGGYLGHLITSVAGSSAYFEGGVISYSNELKIDLLGVKRDTIIQHGAVSEATVCEMAEGACRKLGGTASIAISGIAGPGGGTVDKEVGLVWIAVSVKGHTKAYKFSFGKHRERNIHRASIMGLYLLIRQIKKAGTDPASH